MKVHVIVDVRIESAINLEGQIQIYQKLEKKGALCKFRYHCIPSEALNFCWHQEYGECTTVQKFGFLIGCAHEQNSFDWCFTHSTLSENTTELHVQCSKIGTH